jgi:ABC-type nitrate/sulfonate/bicarbonate transport system substrate-binding protein
MPPALASKRIAGYIVAEPFNALAENLKAAACSALPAMCGHHVLRGVHART